MTIYVEVDPATDEVIAEHGRPDDVGAEPEPPPEGPNHFYMVADRFSVPRPGGHCRVKWVNGARTWFDPRGIVEIKSLKMAEINAAHELANVTSFMFQGKEIQANPHSMRQIEVTNGGVLARGAMRHDWGGAWKALDNSYVPIPDVATWRAFYDAIEETGTANFLKAQALKAQVAAATTIEAVTAIVWQSPEAPA